MSRSLIFGPNEIYHIYNRGTDRRTIFESAADHERFLALLHLCNNTQPIHISNYQGLALPELLAIEVEEKDRLVAIGAYCLMPNHFHILGKQLADNGVSIFMQKVSTAYTMYFNLRQERTGSLFQGPFKAQHVGDDRYLKYLLSYIHLNPVKLFDAKWKENGIADRRAAERFLDTYPYSSYHDFKGKVRPEGVILNRAVLPDYYPTSELFMQSITDWIDSKPH